MRYSREMHARNCLVSRRKGSIVQFCLTLFKAVSISLVDMERLILWVIRILG